MHGGEQTGQGVRACPPHIYHHPTTPSSLPHHLSTPQKHGLKSASKRDKARAAAEEEADEMMELKDRLGAMTDEVGGCCWLCQCRGGGWG